jgi:hypothetical protein
MASRDATRAFEIKNRRTSQLKHSQRDNITTLPLSKDEYNVIKYCMGYGSPAYQTGK